MVIIYYLRFEMYFCVKYLYQKPEIYRITLQFITYSFIFKRIITGMKKSLFIILALISYITLHAKPDVQFKVNAPTAVVVGQQVKVEYTVNADAKDFRVGF